MSEHSRQPAPDTESEQPLPPVTSPLPREITDDPRWQLIWTKLLGPTPDEIAAAKRDGAESERVA